MTLISKSVLMTGLMFATIGTTNAGNCPLSLSNDQFHDLCKARTGELQIGDAILVANKESCGRFVRLKTKISKDNYTFTRYVDPNCQYAHSNKTVSFVLKNPGSPTEEKSPVFRPRSGAVVQKPVENATQPVPNELKRGVKMGQARSASVAKADENTPPTLATRASTQDLRKSKNMITPPPPPHRDSDFGQEPAHPTRVAPTLHKQPSQAHVVQEVGAPPPPPPPPSAVGAPPPPPQSPAASPNIPRPGAVSLQDQIVAKRLKKAEPVDHKAAPAKEGDFTTSLTAAMAARRGAIEKKDEDFSTSQNWDD